MTTPGYDLGQAEGRQENYRVYDQGKDEQVPASDVKLQASPIDDPSSLPQPDAGFGGRKAFDTFKEPNHRGFEFEKERCFQPFCVNFRRLINVIGALLAILNMALDVVYAYQIPYQESLLFQLTCGALLFRLVVTLGYCQYLYTEKVRNFKLGMSHQNDEYEDERKVDVSQIINNGTKLYASFHLLGYTGFFRILPIKDFKNELLFSYLIEFILSVLPQLMFQLFNNYMTDIGNMTSTQRLTLEVKIIFILWLILELAIFLWEYCKIKRMQKDKIKDFEKLSEVDRRAQNANTATYSGIIAMVLFLAILVGFISQGQARQCSDGFVLQAAVCEECEGEQCLSCSSSPGKCDECDWGYYLTKDLKCADCDTKPYNQCLKCIQNPDGEGTHCLQCAEGFRLEDGQCVECSDSDNCAVCNAANCEVCKEGFRLINGKCDACADTLNHCLSCKTPYKCDKCDERMALMTDDGRCDQCRQEHGWYQNGETKKCECIKGFLNVKNNYECSTCQDLIPGCQECSQTDYPGNAYAVEVGHDPLFSPKKGNYVTCVKCGDNMVFDENSKSCRKCSDLINGCSRCNKDGTQCHDCHRGFYKTVDRRRRNVCGSCSRYTEACEACDLQRGCTDCGGNYWQISGVCWKKLF